MRHLNRPTTHHSALSNCPIATQGWRPRTDRNRHPCRKCQKGRGGGNSLFLRPPRAPSSQGRDFFLRPQFDHPQSDIAARHITGCICCNANAQNLVLLTRFLGCGRRPRWVATLRPRPQALFRLRLHRAAPPRACPRRIQEPCSSWRLSAPCKGVLLQWAAIPPGKGSLQPVAIGAAVEVTTPLKPLMERIV